MKKKHILITNDVETHSIYYNGLRQETGLKVYNEALPFLLDIYEFYGIKSTFFFTGHFAKSFPESVKIVSEKGHEIGSHGLTHEVNQSFDILPLDQQIRHLSESKKILEDLSGQEVISFRAPALRVNKNTPVALHKAGFKIDSSVSPQRIDLFMSFGSLNKFDRLFSPRKCYITSPNNLNRKGNGTIIEVPVSSFFLPFTGSMMRASNLTFRILRFFLTFESKFSGTDIVFYMHPTEFIEEGYKNRFKINNRSANYVQYIFADVIRRKIKLKNLGEPTKKLYLELIDYFKKRNYKFITIKEYCKIKGCLD